MVFLRHADRYPPSDFTGSISYVQRRKWLNEFSDDRISALILSGAMLYNSKYDLDAKINEIARQERLPCLVTIGS